MSDPLLTGIWEGPAMTSMDGKVAVVTGGSAGIGRVAAVRCSR